MISFQLGRSFSFLVDLGFESPFVAFLVVALALGFTTLLLLEGFFVFETGLEIVWDSGFSTTEAATSLSGVGDGDGVDIVRKTNDDGGMIGRLKISETFGPAYIYQGSRDLV